MKGWGPKNSACPSKPGNQTFLAGYPGILPGYPGSARTFEKKKFVFNSRPLKSFAQRQFQEALVSNFKFHVDDATMIKVVG